MDPVVVGYLCIGLLFVCLAVGLPVGIALGLLGVGGMYVGIGEVFAFGQVRTLPFAVASNYAFAVLPLFVLMGVLAESSGLTMQVFRAADAWLRSWRGGLYQAVVAGSAVFAAISGSTTVNAVVFTRIALPEMIRHGYSRRLSLGSIAASGSFAAMIPPSITMVIYAIVTEQSVGRLLLAGVIPGLLTAAAYMAGIAAMVSIRPQLAPPITAKISLIEKLRTLKWIWSICLLLLMVLGGLYAGLFPPSAAGAIGAFGAFLIALAQSGTKLFGWIGSALADAASISCVIFLILIGGLLFSRMLVVAGVIDQVVDLIQALTTSKIVFLILVSLMYIALGCFLDTTSMMVITLPFIFPIAVHLEIDPIWFGIILVKLIEISVVTPPIGINLFAVLSAADKDTQFVDVVYGILPFLCLDLLVLALIIVFPALATWLPEQMLI